jgi:hypothetical protein
MRPGLDFGSRSIQCTSPDRGRDGPSRPLRSGRRAARHHAPPATAAVLRPRRRRSPDQAVLLLDAWRRCRRTHSPSRGSASGRSRRWLLTRRGVPTAAREPQDGTRLAARQRVDVDCASVVAGWESLSLLAWASSVPLSPQVCRPTFHRHFHGTPAFSHCRYILGILHMLPLLATTEQRIKVKRCGQTTSRSGLFSTQFRVRTLLALLLAFSSWSLTSRTSTAGSYARSSRPAISLKRWST